MSEPVAWLRQRDNTLAVNDGGLFGSDWTPLYYAALAQPEQLVVGGDDLPTLTKWTHQRKPLTNEEIEDLGPVSFTWRDMMQFARAIEKAHGIS